MVYTNGISYTDLVWLGTYFYYIGDPKHQKRDGWHLLVKERGGRPGVEALALQRHLICKQ